MNVTLQKISENYFRTLNPIAEKISVDIDATKDAYEDLWNTLSYKEQNKIIDETIIHPEVVLKYSFCSQSDENAECFPSSYLHFNGKFGEFSWYDEHSAPFSWMTQSQLDLTVFSDSEEMNPCDVPDTVADHQNAMKVLWSKQSFIDSPGIVLGGSTSKFANSAASVNTHMLKSNSNEERTLFEKLKCSAIILKSRTIKSALTIARIETNQAKFMGCENDILLKPKNKFRVVTSSKTSKSGSAKPVISKPRSPPPPPPNKHKCLSPKNSQSFSETKALLNETLHVSATNLRTKDDVMNKSERFASDLTDNSSKPAGIVVPKTGFDFLDNW